MSSMVCTVWHCTCLEGMGRVPKPKGAQPMHSMDYVKGKGNKPMHSVRYVKGKGIKPIHSVRYVKGKGNKPMHIKRTIKHCTLQKNVL